MSFVTDLTKQVAKFAADNSPAILTAIGVAGTVTTAYMASKATAHSVVQLREFYEKENYGDHDWDDNDLKQKLDIVIESEVWKNYIPAAAVCVGTLACILGANHIGSKRAAGMAAAYSILERGANEYQDKVVEKIGEKKEKAIRDEIAQDRINRSPVKDRQIIIVSNANQLCFDTWSGRYFESNVEELRRIQNDINLLMLNDNYAALTDYYNEIGLMPTKESNEIGWKVGGQHLELEFSSTLTEDNRTCLVVDFNVSPIRDYDTFG
jgi:hypothetical protein